MARNRSFVSAPFDAGLNVMLPTASRRSLLSSVRSSSSRRRLARSSTRRILSYHALTESSMSSTTGQRRNRRYVRVSQRRKTKLRCPENNIEHKNVHPRRNSSSSANIYIRVYTSEVDFHKPEIYGRRVLPSGTCLTARRLEVVAVAWLLWICFVVFLVSVWWDFVFFSFSLLRTHTAYCKYEATLSHVPFY